MVSKTGWEKLRLTDCIAPGLRVLFVGINPGVRSAETGHHFAGYSNRFWKLLWESGLVPEPITSTDDRRLIEFGFGFTNLIARPTPGIDTLSPAEYVAGWEVLERKIKKFKPAVVALVGVTVWRAIVPLLEVDDETRAVLRKCPCPGPQPVTVHGARIHVLPNPSGRNANFSYAEMLEAFRALSQYLTAKNAKRAKSSPPALTDSPSAVHDVATTPRHNQERSKHKKSKTSSS